MYYITKGEKNMSDSTELKVKSFRISDETSEKFKGIASEIGGNQQEVFSKLIEAYEFQKGKAVLTDKKSDIEEFEGYINILTRKYMNVLEDNQNIKALVRTEFEAQLKSKDETIQDLQRQLKEAKEQKEEATKKANSIQNENNQLKNYIESTEKEYNVKMDDMQLIVLEKETYAKTLLNSCDTLSKQVEQMNADIEKAEEQKKELENLKKEYNETLATSNKLKVDLNDLEKEHSKIINEMSQHEIEALERAKLENEKALLELEKKYQKEILELKEEFQTQKQAEIDKYQQKYFDLLEQLKERKTNRNNNRNNNQSINKNSNLSQ